MTTTMMASARRRSRPGWRSRFRKRGSIAVSLTDSSTITPVAANVGATVAAVPADVAQPNTAAGTVNATAGVPILNGATSTVPAPANVLTTVISAPTTPTTGVLASPGATTVPLSLRAGGH